MVNTANKRRLTLTTTLTFATRQFHKAKSRSAYLLAVICVCGFFFLYWVFRRKPPKSKFAYKRVTKPSSSHRILPEASEQLYCAVMLTALHADEHPFFLKTHNKIRKIRLNSRYPTNNIINFKFDNHQILLIT